MVFFESTLLLAFLLGVKHAFDADHLLAVSAMTTRFAGIKQGVQLSMNWAFGHIITVSILTLLLFSVKEIFFSAYLTHLEIFVGVMLIVIGFFALRNIRNIHTHKHTHNGLTHTHAHMHSKNTKEHAHKHLFGVGLVHGLASNDEVLILLTLSIGLTSIFGLFIGLVIFSLGTLLGILGFNTLLSFSAQRASQRIQKGMVGGSGLLSILYGLLLFIGIV